MAKGAHRASGTRTIAKRGLTPLGVVTSLRKLECDRGTTLGEAQAKSLREEITVLELKCFGPHGASDLRAQNRGSTRHQHQRRLPQQNAISTKGGCRSSRRSKMGGEGFEPPKVKPADLQSALVGRLSIRPAVPAWGAGRRSYNALEAAANGFVSSWAV